MIETYSSRTSTITWLRGRASGSDLNNLVTAQKLAPIQKQEASFAADDPLLAFLDSPGSCEVGMP
jgi:hypothetical protein